jgi:hypothetical protein
LWLSGKLSQEVNSGFERTISATEKALKSLQMGVSKKTVDSATCQIISKYTDGKTVWIDIHKVGERSSKVEVRVGAVDSDKIAAEKILREITRRL